MSKKLKKIQTFVAKSILKDFRLSKLQEMKLNIPGLRKMKECNFKSSVLHNDLRRLFCNVCG